ncbi:hypothetical protein E4T56_gene2634 [Termitomyces sp. T112]|nr:hypothetical protein E4T56_gene2634 [Termitomyces sp. T112]
MQPTLNPDSSPWRDIGIFDCVSGMIDRHTYRKGDIVVLRSPDNAKHKLVKRIVALEGDLVHTLAPYPESAVRIPRGHVWVQGDDPFHSDDSNLFGPVPAALIESRLIWIVWPLPRFGRPPKRTSDSRNEGIYRYAMSTFQKDRTRSAKVTFDGIVKY